MTSKMVGASITTKMAHHSSGVLDYAICSPNLFDFITRFDVHDKFPESDHCPISVEFPIDMNKPAPPVNSRKCDSSVKWERVEKFIWNKSDLPKLAQVFDNKAASPEYMSFIDSVSCNDDPDKVARSFNSFFIKSCKRALKSKRSRKLRKRKYKRIDFFDNECKQKRIDAIKAGAQVRSNADRLNLIAKTRIYKSCIQKKNVKKSRNVNKSLCIFLKKMLPLYGLN